jgi:diguanylate cyclase (GGDEF)-like protein/PAS domain S-box-containing protein
MNLALPRMFKVPRLPRRFHLSPASQVAVGLVSLMVSLLLLSGLFVKGFLPDRDEVIRQHRLLAADLIGTQVVHALQARRDTDLGPLLLATMRRDKSLLSGSIVINGVERVRIGAHAQRWHLKPDAPSTPDNLRMPLLSNGQPWGEIQLAFEPTEPNSFGQWLRQPVVLGIGLMSLLGFVAFHLYLRRAMRYLDPSAAVPDRVRTAFDTLTEGLLVLDPKGQVMLANRAFRELGPDTGALLIGSPVDDLQWLIDALGRDAQRPWQHTLASREAVLGVALHLDGHGGPTREVVMNCSPINDGLHRPRGCLVTFSDVTELHERTEGLRVALGELHASREEIRLKNEELTQLATRDGLTGCLNRRAFMAESERALAAAQEGGTPLCCVMCDVDHFKSVNDRFGHGGGDEVLKAVAKALGRGLRTGDLLGRYGGEEFCIVLPNASLAQALEIAERLRADVEANAGNAVRQFADVKVTMSFGVEQFSAEALGAAPSFAALVDHADQALYHSKKTGRNRVTSWVALPTA